MITLSCLLFILYLFAVKGRKTSDKMRKLTKFVYAHRGLHCKEEGLPENSLKAFKAAADAGYGAELDVHLLKDGRLAVIHDSLLVRTTGAKGAIEDITHDELTNYFLEGTTETIPDFESVLALFENRSPLIIELKAAGNNAPALCKAVCDVLDNYNGEYCIESFDPRCLLWLKRNRPDILRGQLSQNFLKNPSGLGRVVDFFLTALVLNIATRPDFVAYRFSDRKDFSYRLCTKFWKTQSAAWTINTPADYEAAQSENSIIIFESFKP